MQNLLSKLPRLVRVRQKVTRHCFIDMFQNLAGHEHGDTVKIDSSAAMAKKSVVFVLGPPGVGKGTQCHKISEKYGFVHISAGELLRKERQMCKSQHCEVIDSCMRNGKIVPSEITCKLLEKCVKESDKNYFLIDGFPRNEENREGWDKTVGESAEILFVLFFDCPIDVCIERCLKRGSSRFDDTSDILTKRITTHLEETYPVLDYYTEKNLVKIIDGSRSEDEIFEKIRQIFESYHFPSTNKAQ